MALSASGVVYTWGKGDYHRLGHGTDEHVRIPMKVAALNGKKVIGIAVGTFSNCSRNLETDFSTREPLGPTPLFYLAHPGIFISHKLQIYHIIYGIRINLTRF